VILNDICVAAIIGGIVALIAMAACGVAFRPRGRHAPGAVVARAREEMAATFWVRDLTPGRSLAGLRLGRDMRRWVPRARRLP
jgi:hypothetical protein